MKTLIIITLVTLSFFSNSSYASDDNKKERAKEKIEKIETKNEKKQEKIAQKKAKEEKVTNKVKQKLEKQLSKFDNLSEEEKIIVYDKLIEKIDSFLGNENISKTQKAVYTLLREIIIERKNSIKK
ncbi:hypothetical protein EOM39_03090 [Candidatus Gracilibacteria bacterium]|nr:hypothetical protein [Candidatus Gracilibacteria bacterium]